MRHLRFTIAVCMSAAVCLSGSAAARAHAMTVVSGPLRAVASLIRGSCGSSKGPGPCLSSCRVREPSPAGTLGFGSNPVPPWGGSRLTPVGSQWWHATRALSATTDGSSLIARLATTDPLGRELLVTIAPAGSGVIAVHAKLLQGAGPGIVGVTQVADGFTSAAGEHFSGFGGRENAAIRPAGRSRRGRRRARGYRRTARSPRGSSSPGRSPLARTGRTSDAVAGLEPRLRVPAR